MMNKYISEFFGLRCAGDVINAVTPINNFAKEVTEAMAIRRVLRKLVLKEPQRYSVMDMCAGNALAGVLAVFTLPILECRAYDKRPRARTGFKHVRAVKRWHYFVSNIYEDEYKPVKDTIIVASHPCGNLAKKIIDIYNRKRNIRALILIPCCIEVGNLTSFPHLLLNQSSLGKYNLWSLYLYGLVKGENKGLYKDIHIASPANNVLWARKDGG
jgi:hypothetical protein